MRTRVEPVEPSWVEALTGMPVILVTVVAVTLSTLAVVNSEASILLAAIAVPVAILGTVAVRLAAAPRRGSACVSQLGS